MKKKVLITGIAGFIGFHFAKIVLSNGYEVVGIDNINDYYNVELKYSRLKELGFDVNELKKNDREFYISNKGIKFYKVNLEDKQSIGKIFNDNDFYYVVNLAAQAGVRYSLKNPYSYINSNILGFLNILENSKNHNVKHIVYASSSSVYGANKKMPFSVKDNVDHPVSLYAATKKSNELMAHTYSHLFGLPTTGLRFFTVYGEWGRPDMALFIFTKRILNEEAIDVYNYGEMKRDFTYIEDIVEGVFKVMEKIPKGSDKESFDDDPSVSSAPYRVFNIGNNKPVDLKYFISLIENSLNKKAKMNLLPLQPGDVVRTYADIDALYEYVGFKPRTSIEEGIKRFVKWYKEYYGIKG